eukprot:9800392-Heterocapsa_arctica.AAC.1
MPAASVMSFCPPGWTRANFDKSYTLPNSTTQQSSFVLCLRTSSMVIIGAAAAAIAPGVLGGVYGRMSEN